MLKNKVQVSVIICTYNRGEYLRNVIKSLLKQSLNGNLFEIIIVNNNSSDDTPLIVKSYQKRIKSIKIMLMNEKKQGAGSARNTGIKHARGQYLAFLDDDALAKKDWLKNVLYYFNLIKPKPIAVGGVILPIYESQKPSWFLDKFEQDYKGDKERKLNNMEVFSGSNMIFQKKILQKYGGFDTTVDIKGDKLSVGEETAIFERIRSAHGNDDVSFYYSPRLVVYHMVPLYKTTVSYRLMRSFVGGQSVYIRNSNLVMQEKVFMLFKYILIVLLSPIIILRYAIFTSNIKVAVVEGFSPTLYACGFIFALLGLRIYFKQRR